MLVVEESGNWGRLIKSLYGQQYRVKILSPVEFKSLGRLEHEHLLIQYCQPCLEAWVSLFDKTGFRLENLGTALLDAPPGKLERSWCQELGFHDLVDDMESLDHLLKRWKNDLSVPSRFANVLDEMMGRIPWSQESHENQ